MRLILFLLILSGSACSYTDRFPQLPDQTVGKSQATAIRNRATSLAPLDSFQVLYRVKQKEPTLTYRYAAVYLAPSSFRLEILPAQGFYSLGLFVHRSGEGLFIDPGTRKVIHTYSPQSLFQQVFTLPIAIEFIPEVLAGRVPAAVIADETMSWYELPDGNIALVSRNQSQYWEIDSESALLQRMQLRDALSGRLYVELLFADYKEENAVKYPGAVMLLAPLAEVELSLDVQSLKLNRSINEKLFTPGIPSDFHYEEQ